MHHSQKKISLSDIDIVVQCLPDGPKSAKVYHALEQTSHHSKLHFPVMEWTCP